MRSLLSWIPKTFFEVINMKKDVPVSVYEVVGSPFCVASGDGEKVHGRLALALENGRGVTLSFRNVEALTSAFLNTAIGQLYGTFNEEQIRSSLRLEDIEPDDQALLKRVVDNAKHYFKDPQRFDQALGEAMEDQDD